MRGRTMPDLKLGKLPDRVPVKMTFTAPPDLALVFCEYAAVYRAAYGEAESEEELIPFMLTSFLEGVRGFAKASRDVRELPIVEPQPRRGRRKKIASQQPCGDGEG